MSLIARIFKKQVGHGIPKVRRHITAPRLEMLETRALLATYTVTNTLDGVTDVGSLRWAVTQANFTTKGLDYIQFNIPGAGVHPIVLGAQLFLNDQVVIDATSQPGYNGQPLIYVQAGINATPTLFTLQDNPNGPLGATTSSSSTIQGLGMYAFPQSAVTIAAGSTGNFIQNNWIGFFQAGTNSPFLTSGGFPSADGLAIRSNFNTIRDNTISGVRNGVVLGSIAGPAATDSVTNSIQRNNIGTDPSGSTSARYGNLADGIRLGDGARLNFLGPVNVISGNAANGINLQHSTNTGNVIFASKIGTDASGNAAIGNGGWGVLLANGGPNGNAVGGPFGGNVISGNAAGGVSLGTSASGGGASGTYVQYNIIGLNGSRTGDFSSVGRAQPVGLYIINRSIRNVIEGNIVAGQSNNGIYVEASEENYISGNYVGQNGDGISIANGGFGVYLGNGASRTFILSTAYGLNRRGNLFQDPNAVGNVFS